MTDLTVRTYGGGGAPVIVLHGGPAAIGQVEPLARELGKRWHVLEPFQRGSRRAEALAKAGGSRSLTVATHVEDLDELVRERCSGAPPALVGHSWGAMLALAYAAAHPATPSTLVLIGCGTFSLRARAVFEARLEARLTPAQRASLAELARADIDDNRRLALIGRVYDDAYGYDLANPGPEIPTLDARAFDETWSDMLRLQQEGVYPAAFAAIRAPVLMLHGTDDPHPGPLIRDDLQRYIPKLEYRELPECGHSPWLERRAKREFFVLLEAWLGTHAQRARG